MKKVWQELRNLKIIHYAFNNKIISLLLNLYIKSMTKISVLLRIINLYQFIQSGWSSRWYFEGYYNFIRTLV